MKALTAALATGLLLGLLCLGGCQLFGGGSGGGSAAAAPAEGGGATATAAYKCEKCGKTYATAGTCCGAATVKVGG
jgi:hypothetical protein